MSTPTLLCDELWHKLLELFRQQPGIYIGSEAHCRRFIEAVLWIERVAHSGECCHRATATGTASLSASTGGWSKRGLWQQLYQRLITEPDLENLLLDSTILRAHACAAGAIRGQQTQALGRSRGGFSSKLHTLVDGLRTLLACVLTGSEVNDITQAETLVFDHASFAG